MLLGFLDHVAHLLPHGHEILHGPRPLSTKLLVELGGLGAAARTFPLRLQR